MANKTIKTRIIQKHAVEADWIKATNFTPLEGELIIYDADATYTYPRFKVGDGATLVNDLPFTPEIATSDDALDLLYSMGYIEPTVANTGAIYTDNNNKIFIL